MKKTFLFVLVMLIGSQIWAQELTKSVLTNNLQAKTTVGLDILNYGKGFYSTQYVAPDLTAMVSKRTSVQLGMGFYHMRGFTSGSEADTGLNGTYSYARVNHQVNQRLRISAEILYGKTLNGLQLQTINAFGNYKSTSFSADYQVAPGFHIGVQVRTSEGMPLGVPNLNSFRY